MPSRSVLARLLLAVGVLQFGAAAAWLAWRWPASPWQALFGAFVIVALPPIVLVIEFVLLASVGGADASGPRPSMGQLFGAWLGEVKHMYCVFYWRLPFRWRAPSDEASAAGGGRTGVVFIHGFVCNRGFWGPWLERMHSLGQPFIAVNLEPVFTSIEDYAPLVDAAVRRMRAQTGLPPVLICHSMGGLVARTWLRSAGGGADRVQRVITLGSPHRGTWLGRFSHTENGRQMRLHSEWLQQLEADEARVPRPPFTCWYSNCDNIVFPSATATLPGADNRLRPGVAHVALAFEPEVMQACLAMVVGPGSR